MKPEWHIDYADERSHQSEVEHQIKDKKYIGIEISLENIGDLLQGKLVTLLFLNDNYECVGMIDVMMRPNKTNFVISDQMNDLIINADFNGENKMTNKEYNNIQQTLKDLLDRMRERDSDCAHPKTMVDKGYSLAVQHMEKEIDEMLVELLKCREARKIASARIMSPPEKEEKTEFDCNGCPIYCPGREDYPDCYCMGLEE